MVGMMRMRRVRSEFFLRGRWGRAPVFVAASLLLAGCGGPTDPHAARRTAKLELVVRHGGAPMTSGVVFLAAEEAANDLRVAVGPNGVTKIAALPGHYTVSFDMPAARTAPDQPPAPPPADLEKIPKVVRNRATSPWKIEAKAGKNRFEFDLDAP